jgi:hypothetical protein
MKVAEWRSQGSQPASQPATQLVVKAKVLCTRYNNTDFVVVCNSVALPIQRTRKARMRTPLIQPTRNSAVSLRLLSDIRILQQRVEWFIYKWHLNICHGLRLLHLRRRKICCCAQTLSLPAHICNGVHIDTLTPAVYGDERSASYSGNFPPGRRDHGAQSSADGVNGRV